MAENDNQNNLEDSVRSMISDRIARLREESAKKTEALKNEKKTEVKPEKKTSETVYSGKTGVPGKADDGIKSDDQIHIKSGETVKTSHVDDIVKDSPKPEEETKKADEEEAKKLKEAQKEEERKKKEALREEQAKIKEAEREERRKQKEAARAEKAKLKEAKKAEKETLKKERIAAAEEEDRQSELRDKESVSVAAAGATAAAAAAGSADAKETAREAAPEAATSDTDSSPEHPHHKGEGVWKSIVSRMNSESAGDDVTGTDIEDESVDEVFITPEDKKRKRTLGMVKLYVTLGAIAAIAIIIAFFTVRNNSFRHIYEQGVKAYNEEEYETAIDTFEKLSLSEEGEHNIDLLNYLAQSYIKMDRYEDALNVYNRALQADPTFGPAVTGLCEMYTKMKDGRALNATLDKYRGTNMEEYIAEYMVSNPSADPAAGKYEEDLEISISGDQNVPIFYTLDGSDPNENSTLYDGKVIRVSEGKTQIKAIAINTLGIRSGIMDNTYTVEYRIPNEPKITLNSGIYVTGQTVTISGDEGCDIYYTTDGSTPTRYSQKYDGPLRLVRGNVILTAISISNHGKESPIASKNYIIVQNARELEKVEQMNNPTSASTQTPGDTQDGGETGQNPNETDGWYTEENTHESSNSDEEGLFDWLFNDRNNSEN